MRSKSVVTPHVDPGVATLCVSVSSCDLFSLFAAASAQASPSAHGLYRSDVGLVFQNMCVDHFYVFFLHLFCSVLSVLCHLFSPFLPPVFGFGFRQTSCSGLSSRQYALPMTVSPRTALTFTAGPNRPVLAPDSRLISVAPHSAGVRKNLNLWLLSVCIYSHEM